MRFFLVVAIYCSLFIYKNSVADDDISLSKHIELLRSNKEIKDSNFVPIFNFGGELNIKYSDNISTIKRKLSVVKNHKASNDYIITDKAFYQNLSRNNDVVFDYNIPENKIFFDNLNVIIKNNNKIFLDYDDIQSSKYTNYLPNQKNPSNFYTDKDYESIIDDLVEYNNYIDEKFKDNTSLFLNANLGFSLNINHNLLKQITSMVQLGIIENGNFIKNKISLYSIDNIAKYILFLGFRLHNESEINFQYGGISNKDLAHKKYIDEFAINTEILNVNTDMDRSFAINDYTHTELEDLLIQSNNIMNFQNQPAGFNLNGTINLNDHLKILYNEIYFNRLNSAGNKKYNNSFLISYKNIIAGNIGIEFDINPHNKIGFYYYNESLDRNGDINNININNTIYDKINGYGFGGMYQYIEKDDSKYQIAWALYSADSRIFYNKWSLINFNYNDNLIKFNSYYYNLSLKRILKYKSFGVTTAFKNQFSGINDFGDDRLVSASLDSEFDLREFLGDKSICDNNFCRNNDVAFKIYSSIKYIKYIDRPEDNNANLVFNIGIKALF